MIVAEYIWKEGVCEKNYRVLCHLAFFIWPDTHNL